jgi:cytochrome c553
MVSRAHILHYAKVLGAGMMVLCVAGALFAWSGLYSVAASRGHWAAMDWFLAFGMRQSVETHSIGLTAPPLDDPDLVRLGAAHFHGGCAYCHGAPGTPISPIAKHMLPSPPALSKAARDWVSTELFWIVKNGIKYTGMPSWVALERDDEVWAVVAFLKKLPGLDVAEYRALALGGVELTAQSGREIATAQSTYDAIAACARCHGAEQRGPMSSLVPSLHGQPAAYLTRALRSYAAGQRKSGIMQPVAAELEGEEIEKVSAYYAKLSQPAPADGLTALANVETGRALALKGAPDRGIPPCVTCHDKQALADYPRLAGQHAAYMIGQLQLWRRGHNAATEHAAIMAPIARQLSETQITEVSAYFATLDPAAAEKVRQP